MLALTFFIIRLPAYTNIKRWNWFNSSILFSQDKRELHLFGSEYTSWHFQQRWKRVGKDFRITRWVPNTGRAGLLNKMHVGVGVYVKVQGKGPCETHRGNQLPEKPLWLGKGFGLRDSMGFPYHWAHLPSSHIRGERTQPFCPWKTIGRVREGQCLAPAEGTKVQLCSLVRTINPVRPSSALLPAEMISPMSWEVYTNCSLLCRKSQGCTSAPCQYGRSLPLVQISPDLLVCRYAREPPYTFILQGGESG